MTTPRGEFLAVQRLEIQFYWIFNPLSIALLCSLIIPVKSCPVQVWVWLVAELRPESRLLPLPP